MQAYRLPMLFGAGSILCIVISLILILSSARPDNPIEFSPPAGGEGSPSASFALTVDIAGAVVEPGVYTLPFGSRVEDAIEAAGGISADADDEAIARSVNRAAKLSDGAKLYFPLHDDAVSLPAFDPQLPTKTYAINAASGAELEELSGVGPVTAQKIIAGRPYGKIEELVEKKVMSQSLFDKLKSQLTL